MDWMNIAFIIIIIVFIIGGFKRAIELKDKPDEDDENAYAAQPPQPAAAEEETLQPPDGYLIYHGSQLNIPRNDVHEILMKHCPYYEPLLPHLKTKFIIRIMRFMETKIFLLPDEVKGFKVQDRVYTAVEYGDPDEKPRHFLLTLAEGELNLYQYFRLSKDLYVGTGTGQRPATQLPPRVRR